MKCDTCIFLHVTSHSEYCWLYEFKFFNIDKAYTNECGAYRTRGELIDMFHRKISNRGDTQ